MKTLHDKRKIVVFTRILSNEKFSKNKNHVCFRDWLVRNKVWVPPTKLSLSKHVKVGWLLRSHPNYTNYKRVTEDLIERIGGKTAVELELPQYNYT